MKKRLFALFLCLTMSFFILAGCGDVSDAANQSGGDAADPSGTVSTDQSGSEPAATSTGGILKTVEGFMYSTLDPHKDYNAWHSQRYGLTESLFRLTDDIEIAPWLAESLEIDGHVATLKLQDGTCFSNGNPLTADMVKRNMERLAEVNNAFLYLNDFELDPIDDKTLVITMSEILPTLKNNLTDPSFCMVDLDATTDMNNEPICTGPFAVETFIPEGDLTLARNENYWGGDVNLDGVVFYAMSDDQSKLMAMQNGEIDYYDSLSATDIEIYSADPDQYKLSTVPSQARTFMYMNPERIPNSVREAVTLVVDRDAITAFMGGVMSPAYGAFNENSPYGAVQQPKMDLEKAKAVLEADGYTLNSSGVYEKDGQSIPAIGLSCYAARSIDNIAVLVQEQLANFGIPTEIKIVEDPEGTYMSDKNYDICFYRMITDRTGDPMVFMDAVVREGAYQDIAGFGNPETDAEIERLRFTMDLSERAELSNKIMKDFYDANIYCALVTYNRNFVLRDGVTHVSENNPYDYYGVNANTTAAK